MSRRQSKRQEAARKEEKENEEREEESKGLRSQTDQYQKRPRLGKISSVTKLVFFHKSALKF